MGQDRLRGIHLGNSDRIEKVMEKASQGKPVVLAFLGGSITQGSLASSPEKCYAYLVYQWWREMFPDVEFQYINAGIGGTTSQFGCARVREDVLAYEPDFVVVDFTVNDENTELFLETYESLIRILLSDECEPAVMALCNVYYDSGKSAMDQHRRVLEHYGVPYVSIGETVYEDVLCGGMRVEEITSDGLHPNDRGHRAVADVVCGLLEVVLSGKAGDTGEDRYNESHGDSGKDRNNESHGGSGLNGDNEIEVCPIGSIASNPLTSCSYENARRLQNGDSGIVCNGFEIDFRYKNEITDVFKHGWSAVRKGASICFEAEALCLAIQYRRTIHQPAPVALAYVDDDRDNGKILDGNFNETWGDSLSIATLLHHGEAGKHLVTVEIIDGVEEDETPFYLVSLIQAGIDLKNECEN
jgi:lysophospholipase L1-like esterase